MIPSTVSTTNQIKQKSNVRSDEIVPKDSWKISPSHKISLGFYPVTNLEGQYFLLKYLLPAPNTISLSSQSFSERGNLDNTLNMF
jgi:hypothetical protein